jgi:hypothetical protein
MILDLPLLKMTEEILPQVSAGPDADQGVPARFDTPGF